MGIGATQESKDHEMKISELAVATARTHNGYADSLPDTVQSGINKACKPLVAALEQIWEEDECGWLLSGTSDKVECVKCGGVGTAPERVTHTEDCHQGFIAKALETHRLAHGQEEKE